MKTILYIIFLLLLVTGICVIFWPSEMNPGQEDKRTINESRIQNVITGLSTCEICGYDAIQKKGSQCKNCEYAINAEAFAEELIADKNSYIIEKQIEFFMPDTLGKSIDFLNPKVSDKGYPKNTNWRPLVFESQIYEYQKMIMEIESLTDTTENIN